MWLFDFIMQLLVPSRPYELIHEDARLRAMMPRRFWVRLMQAPFNEFTCYSSLRGIHLWVDDLFWEQLDPLERELLLAWAFAASTRHSVWRRLIGPWNPFTCDRDAGLLAQSPLSFPGLIEKAHLRRLERPPDWRGILVAGLSLLGVPLLSDAWPSSQRLKNYAAELTKVQTHDQKTTF
jgi:hypothetical protein